MSGIGTTGIRPTGLFLGAILGLCMWAVLAAIVFCAYELVQIS